MITEEGADELFDDETERAHQWLGLHGCSDEVASMICADLQQSGVRVKDAVVHLTAMDPAALKATISATTMKIALLQATATRLSEASKMMQTGVLPTVDTAANRPLIVSGASSQANISKR